VSLQVAILRVLSSYPGGLATVAQLNSDLAILNSSGRDWTDRIKRLADRFPGLDIFSQRYVVRYAAGWQLTIAGYEFLRLLEASPAAGLQPPQVPREIDVQPPYRRPRAAFQFIGSKDRSRAGESVTRSRSQRG